MKKNYKLLIDVNSKYATFILWDNNQFINAYYRIIQKDLTSFLVNDLRTFLATNNVDMINIEAIYFVNGPGSFTNIRLANVLVKTLCALHEDIKLLWTDRLTTFINDKNSEIIVMDSSSTSKFILIHDFNKIIVKTKLISLEEYQKLLKQYENYIFLDITNLKIEQEMINNYLLDKFIPVNFSELKANYMKEPNIDKKVLNKTKNEF